MTSQDLVFLRDDLRLSWQIRADRAEAILRNRGYRLQVESPVVDAQGMVDSLTERMRTIHDLSEAERQWVTRDIEERAALGARVHDALALENQSTGSSGYSRRRVIQDRARHAEMRGVLAAAVGQR